jgi:hypothetical protein
MARPGAGYRPDTLATHDGPASRVLGSLPGPPVDSGGGPARFLAQIGGVGFQGYTESCVAWTMVECIALRAAALGLAVPRGSELALYALARQLALAILGTPDAPLEDRGSEPSVAVRALRLYGLPAQASRPWDPDHILDRVTLGELESGDGTIGLFVDGFHKIDDVGDDRVRAVHVALASDRPVALAVTSLRGDFQDPEGRVLSALPEYRDVDHMVELVDWRRSAQGGLEFQLLNHWGPQWNNGGTCWVDESFVAASADLFIVDVKGTP